VLVELDKADLVSLVRGTEPSYKTMGNPLVKTCGVFNGSYGTWHWNTFELLKLSEVELFTLYKLMDKELV
jgi:hypothetical protein